VEEHQAERNLKIPSVFFGFVSLSAVGDAFHKQRGLISHGQKEQLAKKLFIFYRRIQTAILFGS